MPMSCAAVKVIFDEMFPEVHSTLASLTIEAHHIATNEKEHLLTSLETSGMDGHRTDHRPRAWV
jgi:hypothetical protein